MAMMQLEGKRAVVTGAGSGIGQALALRLRAAGAEVVAVDLDEAGLAETARRAGEGGGLRTVVADVADAGRVAALAAEVAASGGADVLVNNAGISSAGRVTDLRDETLRRTMEVNFWGVVHGTRAFLPQLLARREAALVNVSSVFGLLGVPGQAAYCASKFAVRGFTEALRHELRGGPVAVTVVYPGGVATRIAAHSRVDFPVPVAVLAEAQREWDAQPHLSPDAAARCIEEGIRRRRPRVLIGGDARLIDRLARWLPEGHDGFVRRYLRAGAIWRALDAGPREAR
jgi:NAD(P)-dependent dehydrogenase (short-subunit alcohol dehydrogenase family)